MTTVRVLVVILPCEIGACYSSAEVGDSLSASSDASGGNQEFMQIEHPASSAVSLPHASSGYVPEDTPVADGEIYPGLEHKMSFGWTDVDPASQDSFLINDGMLRASLMNSSDILLRVRMQVDGDGGTNRTLGLPAQTFEIEPHANAFLVFDVDDFGFSYAEQQFSGRVSARFFATDVQSNRMIDAVDAPSLFFHPEGDSLRVYGRAGLLGTYHAGDFREQKLPVAAEGTEITRIVSGTLVRHYDSPRTDETVEAEGDDATPSSGEEVVQ